MEELLGEGVGSGWREELSRGWGGAGASAGKAASSPDRIRTVQPFCPLSLKPGAHSFICSFTHSSLSSNTSSLPPLQGPGQWFSKGGPGASRIRITGGLLAMHIWGPTLDPLNLRHWCGPLL